MGFVPFKSPLTIPNTFQYKLVLYLPPFGRNSNVKFWSPNSNPARFGGYGGSMGSKMAPIEMSSPYSYSTSIHTIGLSCTIWPQCTTRQADAIESVAKKQGQHHNGDQATRRPYTVGLCSICGRRFATPRFGLRWGRGRPIP